MAAKWNQISSANSCCSCQREILFSQTNKCKSCGKLSPWNSNQTRFECGHFCSNAKGKYIHPCIVIKINFVNNYIVKWKCGAWDILELLLQKSYKFCSQLQDGYCSNSWQNLTTQPLAPCPQVTLINRGKKKGVGEGREKNS